MSDSYWGFAWKGQGFPQGQINVSQTYPCVVENSKINKYVNKWCVTLFSECGIESFDFKNVEFCIIKRSSNFNAISTLFGASHCVCGVEKKKNLLWFQIQTLKKIQQGYSFWWMGAGQQTQCPSWSFKERAPQKFPWHRYTSPIPTTTREGGPTVYRAPDQDPYVHFILSSCCKSENVTHVLGHQQ